jgi:molybdate transport system regulatory protein
MDNKAIGQKFVLKGRFWIEGPHGTFLGYGRVRLLERVREYGSISAAARSMKMSYRRAWNLIDAINQQSPGAIVETSTGGKGGGGAVLTERGERAIEIFWAAHRAFEEYLAHKNQNLEL